jgi:hypothetical protein
LGRGGREICKVREGGIEERERKRKGRRKEIEVEGK